MDLPAAPLNLRLAELGRTAPTWAPWIPLVAIVVFACWWYWSKRATVRPSGWWHFTASQRLLYYGQLVTFTDLLALLIEHGVQLGDAVVLAADAGADKRLQRSAREYAKLVTAGVKPDGAAASVNSGLSDAAQAQALPRLSGFPPLVSWLLLGAGTQTMLVESLHATAAAYQRRIERLDDWLRLYLPLIFVIAIGGTAVAIYALSLLGPWYQMLTHFGDSLR